MSESETPKVSPTADQDRTAHAAPSVPPRSDVGGLARRRDRGKASRLSALAAKAAETKGSTQSDTPLATTNLRQQAVVPARDETLPQPAATLHVGSVEPDTQALGGASSTADPEPSRVDAEDMRLDRDEPDMGRPINPRMLTPVPEPELRFETPRQRAVDRPLPTAADATSGYDEAEWLPTKRTTTAYVTAAISAKVREMQQRGHAAGLIVLTAIQATHDRLPQIIDEAMGPTHKGGLFPGLPIVEKAGPGRRAQPEKADVRLQYSIDPQYLPVMRNFAKQSGLSRSKLVRLCLAAYFNLPAGSAK